MRKNRGNLFVVSAPSGAGKTTLCRKLEETLPGIRHSVSHTTRKPRAGEVEGKDYFFVDEAGFGLIADSGGFAEWARVHGNLYGTAKRTLEEMLGSGTDVILDIDVQGAKQLRNSYGEGVFIFVLPPSLDALRDRLGRRMTDSDAEIRGRLRTAKEEIKEYNSYDYVIINDKFEDALAELRAVVVAARLRPINVEASTVNEIFLKEDG